MAERAEGTLQFGKVFADLPLDARPRLVVVLYAGQGLFGAAGQCQRRIYRPGAAQVRYLQVWQCGRQQTCQGELPKLRNGLRTRFAAAFKRRIGGRGLLGGDGARLAGFLQGRPCLLPFGFAPFGAGTGLT